MYKLYILLTERDWKMSERENQEKRQQDFAKIIKKIIDNAEIGLKEFYEKYGRLIQITAKTFCEKDTAHEVMNDVLVKVWKNARKIKNIENPEGWIYTITVNTIKSTFKRKHTFPLNENMMSDKNIINDVIEQDAFDALIKNCTETERCIMIHKFVLKYTFQEIAEETKMPLSTVTSIYYRALKKIEKEIQKMRKKENNEQSY